MSTFEIAVSESSRLCLKLESVFSGIRQHISMRGFEARHLALDSLLDLMQALSRPDVRMRLVHLLQGIDDYLTDLSFQEDVHQGRLWEMKESFRVELDYMRSLATRPGEELSNDALLVQLRAHLSSHGYSAYQMHPLCQLWREQDDGLALSCFQRWLEPLLPFERVVSKIMRFMREHYRSGIYEATDGSYRWELGKQEILFMIAFSVPKALMPQISSGGQLVSVNFHRVLWGKDQVMERHEGVVRFEAMLCRLFTTRRMLRT